MVPLECELEFSTYQDAERGGLRFRVGFTMPVNDSADRDCAARIADAFREMITGPVKRPANDFVQFMSDMAEATKPEVTAPAEASAQPEPPTRRQVAQARCDLFNQLYPVGSPLCLPPLIGSYAQRESTVAEPCRVIDPDGVQPTCCVVMKCADQKHFVSLSYVIGHGL